MSNPNIIVMLADDMGYGDMRCNCPQSSIPTPNLDRLAERGVRFTDAHAASAVCTPSRYSVLTGRYAWRSRLKYGIVWEYDGSLIEPDRPTIASFLREHGYRTACIGKWHLGWDWPTHDGRHPNETLNFGRMKDTPSRDAFQREHINFAGRIGGGPVDRGFDSYFGVDVPNFPPYTWFVDDHLDPLPTEKDKPLGMYGNPGPAAPGWSLEAMIPAFVERSVKYIESAAKEDRPFFLYLPSTSPHSPVVPNRQYEGVSGIGKYGDFVSELDGWVGAVMDALDRTGQSENTLLIFTSDNGPELRTADDEGVYDRARRTGHYSMGPLRGIKRDIWEGGHREPFVACWPAAIPAGRVCGQTICLSDLFATFADIVGQAVPAGAAEDSVSMKPLLEGRIDRPTRKDMVYHSYTAKFALHRGDWVFIDSPTGCDSGYNAEPEWVVAERSHTPHDQPGELFDLREDLPQRVNRYAEHPQRVAEMKARLRAIQGVDASPSVAGPGGPITA